MILYLIGTPVQESCDLCVFFWKLTLLISGHLLSCVLPDSWLFPPVLHVYRCSASSQSVLCCRALELCCCCRWSSPHLCWLREVIVSEKIYTPFVEPAFLKSFFHLFLAGTFFLFNKSSFGVILIWNPSVLGSFLHQEWYWFVDPVKVRRCRRFKSQISLVDN